MPPWLIETLKIVLPGLIVAVITSIITVRLSIRRFHAEKWWEKKQDTYSKLLEALHHAKKYAAEYLGEYDNGRNMPADKSEELTKDWKAFSRELKKLHDLASFILSEKAVNILSEYMQEKKEAVNEEDVYDWIKNDLAAANKCLERLKIEAKRDLKVH